MQRCLRGTGAVTIIRSFKHGEQRHFTAARSISVYVPGARSADWMTVRRKGAVPVQRFKR
ncbi:hypothetical protein [Variovorax soli]|uniref:Uncharacterized protein n=1 Tax=Variovorax soli TaxID=376815 RepID=A0ABU1NM19_9BURK|nr:hypothetical protein [Variovorax soli]MDR6539487.1 hypothetical protein [Variovorax soli]